MPKNSMQGGNIVLISILGPLLSKTWNTLHSDSTLTFVPSTGMDAAAHCCCKYAIFLHADLLVNPRPSLIPFYTQKNPSY